MKLLLSLGLTPLHLLCLLEKWNPDDETALTDEEEGDAEEDVTGSG